MFLRALGVSLLLISLPVAAAADHYKIRFSANELKAFVEVRLRLPDDRLLISDYGAWSQERGWATFISSLVVRGPEGSASDVTEVGKHEWQVEGLDPSDEVFLSYEVDLSHAVDGSWPDGPRTTAAAWDGRGLSMLTGMLFLHSDSDSPSTVEFDLPRDWVVSTPWERTQANTFAVPSALSLTHNIIVVGRHPQIQLDVGGSKIELAALGFEEEALKRAALVVTTTLGAYQSLFRTKTPTPSRYLMAWIADEKWDTGEAYGDSYVISTTKGFADRAKPSWSNTIAHELFHIWVGHRVKMDDWAASQWFSEGVTEYMANTTLARTEVIDQRQILHLMQNHGLLYMRYRYRWGTPYEPLSLIEAGENKSQYNAAIYNGGWVAAFCLDVLLREATENRVGLVDLMRQLDTDFGDGDEKVTLEQVLERAVSLGGPRISDFYDRYVAGVEMIPLQDFFTRAGLDAIAHSRDVDLLVDHDATGLRRSIRESVLGF